MLSESSRLIYGDELITATELNQQPNRVLDLAMEHPVTITRNDQHFALLRREEMRLWVLCTWIDKCVKRSYPVGNRHFSIHRKFERQLSAQNYFNPIARSSRTSKTKKAKG